MFPLLRYLLPLSACCLISCQSVSTAPEPAEFSLSPQELQKAYRSWRQVGIASLHAPHMATVKDAQGATAYLATGGAVLVKDSVPAISAKAPEILLTNDMAELRGKSVVKKEGLLYTGDADDSKIIIDGVFLSFEGPHSTRKPAEAREPESEPGVSPAPEPAPSLAPAPGRPSGSVINRNTGSTVPKLSPAPAPVARSAPSRHAPAKPKPTAPKATSKPAAPTPVPTPAKPAPLDRAKALQLMREPGDG